MSQDGRDDDVSQPDDPLPSPQSLSRTSRQRVVPLEYLIHPERESELIPFAPKEKSLYSFLLHFPIFSAVGAKLSVMDEAELSLLPAMAKWGF